MFYEPTSSKFRNSFIWSDPDLVYMGLNDHGQKIDLYREKGLSDSHPLIALVYEKEDLSDMTCHVLHGSDAAFYMEHETKDLVRVRGDLHWVNKKTFDASRPMIRIKIAGDGQLSVEQCFDSTIGLFDDTPENRAKLFALIEMP